MTHYEMAEKLSEKMNVTLEQATAALEACDWEMLDAALKLEKERGEQAGQAWSTAAKTAEKDEGRDRRKDRGHLFDNLGDLVRSLLSMGTRNRFEVRKGESMILDVPVLALVLLLIFAFWVCIPLLVIGLFAGYRYTFSGEELGRESVNRAMDKAAEVAGKVKEEVSGEH